MKGYLLLKRGHQKQPILGESEHFGNQLILENMASLYMDFGIEKGKPYYLVKKSTLEISQF